jgi:hypothetical protein
MSEKEDKFIEDMGHHMNAMADLINEYTEAEFIALTNEAHKPTYEEEAQRVGKEWEKVMFALVYWAARVPDILELATRTDKPL